MTIKQSILLAITSHLKATNVNLGDNFLSCTIKGERALLEFNNNSIMFRHKNQIKELETFGDVFVLEVTLNA